MAERKRDTVSVRIRVEEHVTYNQVVQMERKDWLKLDEALKTLDSGDREARRQARSVVEMMLDYLDREDPYDGRWEADDAEFDLVQP